MEHELNRATVFESAEAVPTETREGRPTVTVRATFSQDSYSQTNSTHLSMGAALDLYCALKEVLHL